MDRIEFAKILKSIVIPEDVSDDELKKITKPISEAIMQMIPASLFRYRCCDEKGLQIDAFKNDKIYTVTADKFNDPYDTLVKFDINNIKQFINTFLSCDVLKEMQRFFQQGYDIPNNIKQIFSPKDIDAFKTLILTTPTTKEIENSIDEYKTQLLSQIEFWFPLYAKISKHLVTIACFCETVQSITMWSHYADYHKGFALEYNSNQLLRLKNLGIYPVIYDEERYDASIYLIWFWAHMTGYNIPQPDKMSHIKCVLHKSQEWEYEKEWRMINYLPRNILEENVSSVYLKPKAIYYGCEISQENKKDLHEIAIRKNIREYDMFINYSSSKYKMLCKPTVL